MKRLGQRGDYRDCLPGRDAQSSLPYNNGNSDSLVPGRDTTISRHPIIQGKRCIPGRDAKSGLPFKEDVYYLVPGRRAQSSLFPRKYVRYSVPGRHTSE